MEALAAFSKREGTGRGTNEDGEPTSAADLAVEAELSRLLWIIRPDAGFLGEESFRTSGLSLSEVARLYRLWIIDPIEGTSNVLSGSDDLGTMASFTVQGEAVAAWNILPAQKLMCSAEKGSGVVINSERCRLSYNVACPRSAVLATGDFSADQRDKVGSLREWLGFSRGTSSGAVDYVDLIIGKCDLSFYKRPRPWDHAAGVLIHKEA